MPATGDPALGARLRELRKQAGLTQVELVARMKTAPRGRDGTWVSNVEGGRHMPTVRDVIELAAILGTTTDQILIGDHQPLDDERLLLFALRRATPQARRSLLASARAIAEEAAEYSVEDAPSPREGEATA